MTSPPSPPAGFATIPGGAASLLVDPTATFATARRTEAAAIGEFERAKGRWRKRLFAAQCLITLLLFLKWTGAHSLVAAAMMAGLAFVPLCLLPAMAGLFARDARQRMTAAVKQSAAERQAEVERTLAGMRCGRYQWIRRGGEYLAVFPESGFLYHFGSASGDRHLLLDAARAVQQVRVSTETRVEQTTTGTTTHGRRLVVAATPQVGMIGKGRSTTKTTTATRVTSGHTLEIQFQTAPGAPPGWIALPFGADNREAENWRLLVAQLGR